MGLRGCPCRGRGRQGPLPRARRAGRPLRTIFSQGERAAPGWYAALGIPAGRSPRLSFLGCRPPCAPRRAPGGRTGPGSRSPCGAGSGVRGSPAWRGASPPPGLPFMACVRAGSGDQGEDREPGRDPAGDREPEARARDGGRRAGETQVPETERDSDGHSDIQSGRKTESMMDLSQTYGRERQTDGQIRQTNAGGGGERGVLSFKSSFKQLLHLQEFCGRGRKVWGLARAGSHPFYLDPDMHHANYINVPSPTHASVLFFFFFLSCGH